MGLDAGHNTHCKAGMPRPHCFFCAAEMKQARCLLLGMMSTCCMLSQRYEQCRQMVLLLQPVHGLLTKAAHFIILYCSKPRAPTFENAIQRCNVFMQDELRPISCTGHDSQGGVALTLIDALDSLVVGHVLQPCIQLLATSMLALHAPGMPCRMLRCVIYCMHT